MRTRLLFKLLATAVLCAGATGTLAADAAAGRAKTSTCAGCHGIEGYRWAYPEVYHVPKLGGQHAGYMIKALQGYKNGSRNHPTMRAIAASLTDADIADLAAYYASVKPGDNK